MVSIIVPIYNLEGLIPKCINSIIAQTNANWELILVDDGSTDSSLAICTNFASSDNRIKIISQQNSGAAAARQTGVNIAMGEWITFVDGDDILPPDAISLLITATLEDNDADIIAGNVTTQLPTQKISNHSDSKTSCNSDEYISLLLKDLANYGPYGKLFKRELFDKACWDSNIPLSNYEDLLMLVSLSSVASKIIIRNDLNVYTYVLRNDSASKSHLSATECQILFDNLSPLVNDRETFFLFRLRRIYDNCIVNGEKLYYRSDLIQNLLKDRNKHKLSGHDRLILLMLYSKRLRHIVSKRHSANIEMRKGISVSIIISAYNEEKNIARAIKSATAQSLKDIEVIVVNDASTDKTADIVSSFAATDNRIRLISHDTNMGLNNTRITGLNAANGEFITFMDGDDTIEPFAAEKLYQQAIDSTCDIIAMGTRRVTRFLRLKLPFFSPAKAFNKQQYNTQDLLPLLLGKSGISLSLCDKLYRRELLLSLNLKGETLFMGEDMLTNLRIFNGKAKISWIDYIGYNWTTGGDSSKSAAELWYANKNLCNRCFEILEEINASTAENLHALACGAVNSFIYAISQQLVNPFASTRKCKEWIKAELQSDFWDNVIPHLNDNYDAIAQRDTDGTLNIARQHLNTHRLSYLALKLLMQ